MEKLLSPYPRLLAFYEKNPLTFILIIAAFIRLVAAFFSKGYAFHDDHFDVITVAQHWLYGLPHWVEPNNPPRHSMFYVIIHYVIFYISESVGIGSPESKMLVVRIIHGLYSLLIVYFGYKITALISYRSNAALVGLILSLIWFMPFMSVRNLVEMVCIPPYLAAFYYMLKDYKAQTFTWKRWLFAGILFGLAFVIRYHSILFIGGAGVILLFRKQWKEAFILSCGFLLSTFAIQGTIDMIMFQYPFHSVVAYYEYNTQQHNVRVIGPAYRFLLTVLGFLVPPISLFLIYGFIKSRKIEAMMFSAALVFFAFHSIFPHKQERFILPLFPLIIILGVVGWRTFVVKSAFWQKRERFLKGSWTFFWVLNIAAALALGFTYSKKSRIAPLSYLANKENIDAILVETSEEIGNPPPAFYLGEVSGTYREFVENEDNAWKKFEEEGRHRSGNFIMVYELGAAKEVKTLKTEIKDYNIIPDYLVLTGRENLAQRIQRLKTLFPNIKLEREIEPSRYDQLLHFLNPRVHEDGFLSIYKVLD